MNRYVESSLPSLGRWLRAGALFGATCSLAGCVTQQIEVVNLSGVVRGNATFTQEIPHDAIQLTRGDKVYAVVPEMPLEVGDALRTGPDTSAVVSYPGGARVYIYPNTQVRIGSIIDDLGKVFVKVTKAQGVFKVKTKFVTAGSEGTEYWVDVRPRDEVRVVVVEDVVKLESTSGAWPSQRLSAGQQALFRGAAPGLVSAADPAEIRRETDWVRAMDQRVPVKKVVSKWALVLIPIAAAVIFGSGPESPPAPRLGN